MLTNIIYLVKKELLLEWRQKHTFFGALLYIGCTVFVLYMMAGKPEAAIWNALFWIAQLFITVNTVAKSFLAEGEQRSRYYFTIVSPTVFIISKMLYNLLLMIIMSLITLGLFNVLMHNPLTNGSLFVLVTCLGASSLSLLFTFLSAIASQAKQSAAMMAILGFPIALPLLMILSKLSYATVVAVQQEGWGEMAFLMAGMNVLILILGAILFPFIWKE